MKRVVVGMGVANPAHVEPEHTRYDATIDVRELKKLISIANKTKNADLVNGLIKLIRDDIKYDTKAGQVSKSDILNHYKAHVAALQSAKVGDKSLIDRLIKQVKL